MFACFTLAFVIAIGRVATGGGLAWSTLAGVAAGLADRDQGNVGHRPACRARRLRDLQVVAGTRTVADPGGRWAMGEVGRRGPDRGGGGRGALLLVVSRRPRRRPRAAPCGRHLPRPRRGPRDPRAPVAFLPRPPRLLVVRGPDVDRGGGARARCRRRGVGMGPAASERPVPSTVEELLDALSSPATLLSPRQSSPPSRTRLPGICCPSTSG